ncbi:hypothetical protein, partial [Campylobacter sp.]|uniref:hypothetical protein n=1 Tax=Campylobacter sp. TaxID=205 RepID=UPI002AA68C75
ATNIDLSKLKNGTVDGAVQNVSILVKDVKSGTLNLEPAKDNQGSVKETISLDSSAKSVVINNFEAQNDKITIAGATNTGQTLTAAAANLTANGIYGIKSGNISVKSLNDTYFSASSGLAEKEVIYLFADDAAAVGGQGKSYQSKIYKVTFGSDNKVSTVELMATVNQSANKSVIDPTSNTTVVTDPEKGGSTNGLAIDYSTTSLDLSADQYNSKPAEGTLANYKTLAISGVSGALSVTKSNETTDTLIATIKDGGSLVFGDSEAARAITNVDLKVGGTVTNNAETNVLEFAKTTNAADIEILAATLKEDTDKIVEVWQENSSNKVKFADTSALAGVKLDLSKVNANIAITALTSTPDASGTTANTADLAELFVATSVNKDDAIEVTLASSNKGVKLTSATETVKLHTSSADVAITNAASGDKLGVDSVTLADGGELAGNTGATANQVVTVTLAKFNSTADVLTAAKNKMSVDTAHSVASTAYIVAKDTDGTGFAIYDVTTAIQGKTGVAATTGALTLMAVIEDGKFGIVDGGNIVLA